MKFLNFFRKKPDKTTDTEKIWYYYIYGFVNTNPNYQFRNQDLGEKLFKKIIGDKGGIVFGNSLHPYYTIDQDGDSIWDFAFLYLSKNNPGFQEDLKNKSLILLELSSKFNQMILWEDDTRLTFEENPVFGKLVPFVVPFIVYDKSRSTNFDTMILKELNEHQHAHHYLGEINSILKQFMHETVFTIGFDEFQRENKSKMIDNFMKAKLLFEE